MKTLLVLGATPFQIPIVNKAKEKGHRVITMDNVPENPAHNYADESAFISTIDTEAVLLFAQERCIDGIMTGGSDVGVASVGRVVQEMGLSGITYEQGKLMTQKDQFRAFQKVEGLPHPSFHVFDSWTEFSQGYSALNGKFVIKPVDRSGSTGVSIIDFSNLPSVEQLKTLFESAWSQSLKNRVIVEEFLDAEEHGGDIFLNNGKCISFTLTNKYLTPDPYCVPVGHTIPSRLSASLQKTILDSLMEVLERLNITNGPVNFDVMLNEHGDVTVLEMSPRFGGNCIPQIIEFGTGFDEIGATIDLAIEGSFSPETTMNISKVTTPTGSRILKSTIAGILKNITPQNETLAKFESQLHELVYDVTPGDDVRIFTQGSFRIGHIIASSDSLQSLEVLLDGVESTIQVDV